MGKKPLLKSVMLPLLIWLRKIIGTPIREKRYRYGLAVVAAGSAIFIRLVFLSSLGNHVTYLTFYPAVMLAALYGGFRAGVLAAVFSAVLADYFLMEPFGVLAHNSSADWLGMAIFMLCCVCISYIAEALHRAQQRAAVAEAAVQHAADRLRNEERLRVLNRTLQALNNSSQTLVRATDETALLQEVCRIIVEDCGHAMVWVGFAENDAEKSIRPAACSGFEQGYLETLRLTWADAERGLGPTGKAIRTGAPCMCRNMLTDPVFAPWREEALRRGYASSLALPLTYNGAVFGALTLYSREQDPFTEDELKLLSELASDLAFGICALRLRQANIAAEEALRKSEAQFRMLFDSACDGIFIMDQQGRYIDANVRGLDMLGNARQEMLGRNIGDFLAEHEKTRVPEAVALIRGGHPHIEEWQFVRRDGSVFSGEINAQLLPDGRMVGILRDITDRKLAQNDRDLTIEFLRRVNVSKNTDDLMHTTVQFFKDHADCDAVGIRLREGADYPYRVTLGFSKEFLETERTLCECGKAGGPLSPACLCGKVITGHYIPAASCFTAHGSFYSTDTSQVLKIPFTDKDLIRNTCIKEGYGSIALLPLHEGSDRMGILQLNFRRKGAFKQETVSLWERLAGHLAVAVSKFRTEEALRTSEDLNRRTLQALPAHIAVIDREGRIITVNTAWTDFALGNAVSGSAKVTVGTNYLEVCRRSIAEKDADATQALAGIEAVLASTWDQFNMEYPCHSNQEKRWFLMTVAPFGVRGEGGAVIAHLNITARKLAEEALRESEARFRNVFDHAATGIAIIDCAGRFVQCNAAYSDLTGYSQAELATMEFSALIHPEDRERNIAHIRKLLAGEIPSFEIESRYLRKAGGLVWAHKYVSLLRDDRDQPTHIVALVTDTTERKQTEDVLRFLGQCKDSDNFFQELARYLSWSLAMDFVCIDRLEEGLLSAQTLAVFHNGQFEDNVSYTLKDTPCGDVVGKRICCFPRNVRGLFAKDVVLQNLQAESYLGTTLWSSQGRPIGLIAVIGRQPLADTRRAESILQMVAVRAAGELERQQAEADLRRAKVEAERASQAKSDFLASVSHELRTPLNAVMGFAQVLDHEYFGPLTAKQKEYVNDIYESGKHLLTLINDILDLSKIEAGKMEPFWQTFNVEDLLANSLVFVREKCAKHNIHLEFAITEPTRGLMVTADERRLKQVLYNLLSNAAKFTPDGGSITLQACMLEGAEPTLEVSVSDTGIGIAPEHQEKVFEAFYQVRNGTTNKTPGTGLGLSLVKQLLAIHDGRIWVTSDGEGRGSRFTFVIPVNAHTSKPPQEGERGETETDHSHH